MDEMKSLSRPISKVIAPESKTLKVMPDCLCVEIGSKVCVAFFLCHPSSRSADFAKPRHYGRVKRTLHAFASVGFGHISPQVLCRPLSELVSRFGHCPYSHASPTWNIFQGFDFGTVIKKKCHNIIVNPQNEVSALREVLGARKHVKVGHCHWTTGHS